MDKAGGVVVATEQIGGQQACGSGFAFVGRERELGLLLAAVRHPPAVVLVEGEAGIGKSRLVYEATRELAASGGRVLTGCCHPLREPFPYGPVADALRGAGPWLPAAEDLPRAAGALAPLLPDMADRLPEPPGRPVDAHAERFQLVTGLRSFLDALGPVVLVVEDVHWVDESTRELLLLLARDMPARVSLVLTFRTEDLRRDSVLGSPSRRRPGTNGVAIHLHPLSEHAVRELARHALGAHATPRLAEALYRRSEGLPLVAEEDLITLADHGRQGDWAESRDLIADLEHSELPRGLREAFAERMAGLSAPATAVVEAAAVLGVPAAEQLLGRVAGLDAEHGSLAVTEALRAAVLRECDAGRYCFRHALAQQAAYQQIPGPRRAMMHRRAIAVLEAEPAPPLVQIAHHALQLGDLNAWLDRAQAAADQAIALGDAGTAAAVLHHLLDRPDLPGAVRSRAALALAGIAVNGVDYATNAAALRRLLADPRLPADVRGEIRLSLGLLMVNHAGDRTGFEEIGRAAGELAGRPDRAARAMVALAMNERDGAGARARTWLEQAEEQARRSGDDAVRAAVEATRLTLLARDGDPEVWALADRLPRDSAQDDVVRQTARALYNTGEIAMELGHDRRAARMMAESCGLAQRVSFPHMESYCRIALLRLDALAGHWTGIEERFAALRGEYPDIAMAKTDEALTLGMVAAARGRRTRAKRLFTEALAYGESESQVTAAMRAAAGLARTLLAEHAPREAWAYAAPAVATLREAAAWARGTGLVPVAVEAALACGEEAFAEDLLADAQTGLEGRDAPAAAAQFQTARGVFLLATDPAAAAGSLERARCAWTEIGRPYEAALVSERLGAALAGRHRAEATAQFEEALAAYTLLGAEFDSTRCQRTMRGLGLGKPAPRGRRGYGGELSPRELQVAELVARGATNRDIAEALFLSPRTVEQHVARLLRKLGATRGDVPDALRRVAASASGAALTTATATDTPRKPADGTARGPARHRPSPSATQ